MKLHFLNRYGASRVQCVAVKQREFLRLWHYHSEVELVYIVQGTGTLYVGDFIGEFRNDDVYLFGSNLPHMFDSVPDHPGESESITIHFNDSFLRKLASVDVAFSFITRLLNISQHGLLIQEESSRKMLSLFREVQNASEPDRYLQSIRMLHRILGGQKFTTLGSTDWGATFDAEDDRMGRVVECIMLNFRNNIELDQVSRLAGMNKSAFCRYFKQITGKTFVLYVNNVRINYACRLLREKQPHISVSVACYESGFNSLSYFNRVFKRNVGCTPREYVRERGRALTESPPPQPHSRTVRSRSHRSRRKVPPSSA